ncbi:MAG: tetratricopeptide repeat protein, partial [Fimbriiglobus sp.]
MTPPLTRRDAAIAAGLFVAAAVLYWPAVGFQFVNFDDPGYVTGNPRVLGGLSPAGVAWAFSATAESNWHPLTWLSLQLDATLFGPGPAGFHRTNVLFHAANAALLYVVLRRLTGAVGRSAAVALLFAVHPLHVESVAWVSERKDVLSVFFGLLGMWAYARYAEDPSGRRMAGVAGLLALSLMAKPMLVTFPFVLLLLDFWPLGRLRGRPDAWPRVREKWPLFVLIAASAVVTLQVQAAGGAVRQLAAVSLADRLAGAAAGYAFYLQKSVVPSDLNILYQRPFGSRPMSEVAGSVAVLLAATAVGIWVRHQSRCVLVGWLWYLGTLVPVIGLVTVGDQAYADRYAYFPQIGLLIAVVWGCEELRRRFRVPPRAAGIGVLIVSAVFVGSTRHQLTYWADSRTLWER